MRLGLGRYALSMFVVLALAGATFTARRNADFQAGALAEARGAQGVLVSAPQRSAKYTFLKRRSADGRPLGGSSGAPDDKILADAATQAERDGEFARFLPDGRVVAARPAAGGTTVALIAPAARPTPIPWPWLALMIAGGAVVAWPARGRALGLALLVPALAARSIPAGVAALALGGAATLGWLDRAEATFRRHRVAYTYLLPAGVGMAILVLAPFVIGCALGFYDHAHGEWHYVGLKNFATILGGDGRALDDPLNFWFTLGVTVLWTALNVALHVTAGVVLALALRERWLRLRGVFRVLLILPWAVPNYITALIWRGMFQTQFGAVNALLHALHMPTVGWFSHFSTSFTANVVTNTWLGFPFMMVVALGALESIPRDLYEAAAVDGARTWDRFVHITLPNLKPALGPAVILGSVWTFNMFNVIYLVSGGKPAGATDILVTQAYRWAFERGQRYGMAAAYATLIFLILLGWTLVGARAGRRKQEEVAA